MKCVEKTTPRFDGGGDNHNLSLEKCPSGFIAAQSFATVEKVDLYWIFTTRTCANTVPIGRKNTFGT